MESVRQGGTGAALTDGALKTFPFITYTTFLVFFFLVSIVALNVLVGLTVDDIRNFLENADLRKLTMRLKFIMEMELLARKSRENKKRDNGI